MRIPQYLINITYAIVCSLITGGMVYGQFKSQLEANNRDIIDLKNEAVKQSIFQAETKRDLDYIKRQLEFMLAVMDKSYGRR